jgi:hypothetical protein
MSMVGRVLFWEGTFAWHGFLVIGVRIPGEARWAFMQAINYLSGWPGRSSGSRSKQNVTNLYSPCGR